MPRAGYYRVTRNALEGITQVYDFMWPATAAIWNLRWQVKGYLLEAPTATEEQLKARFAHPSGSGSNYRNFRKGFAGTSWESHEAQIASLMLTTLVSEYEAWCRAILVAATGSETFADANEKGLQFPSTSSKGVGPTVAKTLKKTSKPIMAAFQPVLTSHPRYAVAHLENLMYCFRYFKETRNALAHGGGVVSQRMFEAGTQYIQRMAPRNMGMPHPPTCPPQNIGDAVALTLKQVASFGEVILRLFVTVDGQVAQSEQAEKELFAVWAQHHGATMRMMPADSAKRRLRIANAVERAGLPKPVLSDDLPNLLKGRRLVFF
jgi:hypothetical protein